jgi:hypothetical protein
LDSVYHPTDEIFVLQEKINNKDIIIDTKDLIIDKLNKQIVRLKKKIDILIKDDVQKLKNQILIDKSIIQQNYKKYIDTVKTQHENQMALELTIIEQSKIIHKLQNTSIFI